MKDKPNYFVIYTIIAMVSFPFLLLYVFVKGVVIMANPVGRPRTKLNDLPADWESIICMAAQDGAADVS